MACQHFVVGCVRIADAGDVSGAARAGIVCRRPARRGQQQNPGRPGRGHVRPDAGFDAASAGHRFRPFRPEENHLFRPAAVCRRQFSRRFGRFAGNARHRPRIAGRGGGECRGNRVAGRPDARGSPHPFDGDDRLEHRHHLLRQPDSVADADQRHRCERPVYHDGPADFVQHGRGGVLDPRPRRVQTARRRAGAAVPFRRSICRPPPDEPQLRHLRPALRHDGPVYHPALHYGRAGAGQNRTLENLFPRHPARPDTDGSRDYRRRNAQPSQTGFHLRHCADLDCPRRPDVVVAFTVADCRLPDCVLYRFQHLGSQPAFHGFQNRPRRFERHGHGRI